jgi:hypothetical protein
MDPHKIPATMEPTSRQYLLTDSISSSSNEHSRNSPVRMARDKIRYSVIAIILFLLISSPSMYRFMESILGRILTISIDGMPTTLGLVLHSLVFGLLFYVVIVLDL